MHFEAQSGYYIPLQTVATQHIERTPQSIRLLLVAALSVKHLSSLKTVLLAVYR